MSRVEVFATEIKTESSDQKAFFGGGTNQGIKVTSKLLKSMDQECTAAIWPLTLKIKWSTALKGAIKWSSTLFGDQTF